MQRRTCLACLGGLVGSLAGCTAPTVDGDEAASSTRTPPPDTVDSVAGIDLPVPREQLRRGASRDAIPAITDPVFGDDWSGIEIEVRPDLGPTVTVNRTVTVEPRLEPEDLVIGLTDGDRARAYPLRILNWHEVVNDEFDGPALVTYCPLCGSAIVADRLVRGGPSMFGVSGLLWRSNLVLYDRLTESLWGQLAATAIRGPMTGKRLSLRPSSLTTLGAWRESHPDTQVLRPPPESETVGPGGVRNYQLNPYATYEASGTAGLEGGTDAGAVHPQTRVLGIAHGSAARAYPLPTLVRERVVNDVVGGLPVVVAVGPDDTDMSAYVRRVDGEVRRFRRADDAHFRAARSRWNVMSGRAVDGPHEGTTLQSATERESVFWFSWRDLHPESDVYGQDVE